MLSPVAMKTLSLVGSEMQSCSNLNRQIIDKLRREGFVKVVVKRAPGAVPLRFCKITEDGLRFLAQHQEGL